MRPHGTATRYKYGCRCVRCRRAKSVDYQRYSRSRSPRRPFVIFNADLLVR